MKVNEFYKDGQRIVDLLEKDKMRYTEYAASCVSGSVSRETYKAIVEYVDWLLEWVTVRGE